jgi:tRNA modification GTPase
MTQALANSANDTIAATASPSGLGGIGIVRISGPKAGEVAARLFRPADASLDPARLPQRHMLLGEVIEPGSGEAMDEVLCVRFAPGGSYTTEEVIEIQCHAGPAVVRRILLAALDLGCRLARPGEFTQRAFLGGRLDLTQAEAVGQLIGAQSTVEARLALAGLAGGLGRELAGVRAALTEAAAAVEAAIDFPEEVAEIAGPDLLARLEQEALAPLQRLLGERQRRRVWREGALVVICGRPNVGKSSLFNALLGQKRAIVTEMAGTTRDSIEESAVLGGVVCRLTDTAGLGVSSGDLDRLGMEAARERLAVADLALVVLDGSAQPNGEDQQVLQLTQGLHRVLALNKSDLERAWEAGSLGEGAGPALRVSAKFGQGLDELAAALGQALTGGEPEPGPGEAVASARQAEALAGALEAGRRGLEGLGAKDAQPELVSVDLALALARLGEVDGQGAPDQVIDAVFETFCVGK